MKKLIVVVLFMMYLPNILAQGTLSQDGKSSGQRPSVDMVQQLPMDLKMKKIKKQPLFFKLPLQSATQVPLSVQFRVRVDKLPYFVERFRVNTAEATLSPAVELLSGDPARLNLLYRIAKNRSHEVDLAVVVDGKTVREFSFDEFLDYNSTLRQEGFQPIDVSPTVLLLRRLKEEEKGTLSTAASDCEMQCDNEYAACAEMECGSPTVFCDPCLDALNRCREACPPPPCSPQTTHRTETYLRYCVQQSGPICMYNTRGYYTVHYYVTCYYDRYYISRTQNCDGTVTESVYHEEIRASGYFDTGEPCPS